MGPIIRLINIKATDYQLQWLIVLINDKRYNYSLEITKICVIITDELQ